LPHSDLADIAWFENFFQNRVLPRACVDMGEECQGFFSWMAANDPELYARIQQAEDEINSLWHPEASRESFKAACKVWYGLLMEAKQKFEAWKSRQREQAANVGKQEAMAL
jgi:hypothetical protein